jgi:hypothetical protein
MAMTKDWKELLRLFNEIGVEYCVVSSVALSWHGFPRYTGDMDLLVAPTEANVQRVLAALEQFGMTSLGSRGGNRGYDGRGTHSCDLSRPLAHQQARDRPIAGLGRR